MSAKRPVIILTGATGFAGCHVLKELLPDFEVVILKRSTSDTSRISALLSQTRCYDVDKIAPGEVIEHEVEATGVVHLATCYTTRAGSVEDLFRANVDFPLSILQALGGRKGSFLINADTFYPRERDDYGRAKADFREKASSLAPSLGVDFINARLEHIYGPADSADKFIPSIIRRCLDNVPEIKLSSGVQTRDFVHISDAARAFALLARCACTRSLRTDSFQIGTGRQLSIRALVELIHKLTASQTHLLWGALPTLPGEIMASTADNRSLLELGWSPQIPLESGLKALIEEIRLASGKR